MGPTHTVSYAVWERGADSTLLNITIKDILNIFEVRRTVFLILLHTIWIIIRITKLRVELLNKTPNKFFSVAFMTFTSQNNLNLWFCMCLHISCILFSELQSYKFTVISNLNWTISNVSEHKTNCLKISHSFRYHWYWLHISFLLANTAIVTTCLPSLLAFLLCLWRRCAQSIPLPPL